jgi:hypothetical protein
VAEAEECACRVSVHHDVDLGDIGPARNLRLHVDRQLDAAAENVTHFVMNEEIPAFRTCDKRWGPRRKRQF